MGAFDPTSLMARGPGLDQVGPNHFDGSIKISPSTLVKLVHSRINNDANSFWLSSI